MASRTGIVTVNGVFSMADPSDTFALPGGLTVAGGITLQPLTAATQGLKITGRAAQSADLLSIVSSSEGGFVTVSSAGLLSAYTGAKVYTDNPGLTPLSILGANSQTEPMLLIMDADDNQFMSVSNLGATELSPNSTVAVPLTLNAFTGATANIFRAYNSTTELSFVISATGAVSALKGAAITAASSSTEGLTVKGVAGQTADILKTMDNTNGACFYVDANGTAISYRALIAQTSTATNVPLEIRGSEFQTAPLLKVADNDSNELMYLDPDGKLYLGTIGVEEDAGLYLRGDTASSGVFNMVHMQSGAGLGYLNKLEAVGANQQIHTVIDGGGEIHFRSSSAAGASLSVVPDAYFDPTGALTFTTRAATSYVSGAAVQFYTSAGETDSSYSRAALVTPGGMLQYCNGSTTAPTFASNLMFTAGTFTATTFTTSDTLMLGKGSRFVGWQVYSFYNDSVGTITKNLGDGTFTVTGWSNGTPNSSTVLVLYNKIPTVWAGTTTFASGFMDSSGTLHNGYNIKGMTEAGDGVWDIEFVNPAMSAVYPIIATAETEDSSQSVIASVDYTNRSTTAFRILTFYTTAPRDPATAIAFSFQVLYTWE